MISQDKASALRTTFELLIDDGTFRSCINCLQWDEQEDKCSKYNAKPPAKIIVFGCPEWEDPIPF